MVSGPATSMGPRTADRPTPRGGWASAGACPTPDRFRRALPTEVGDDRAARGRHPLGRGRGAHHGPGPLSLVELTARACGPVSLRTPVTGYPQLAVRPGRRRRPRAPRARSGPPSPRSAVRRDTLFLNRSIRESRYLWSSPRRRRDRRRTPALRAFCRSPLVSRGREYRHGVPLELRCRAGRGGRGSHRHHYPGPRAGFGLRSRAARQGDRRTGTAPSRAGRRLARGPCGCHRAAARTDPCPPAAYRRVGRPARHRYRSGTHDEARPWGCPYPLRSCVYDTSAPGSPTSTGSGPRPAHLELGAHRLARRRGLGGLPRAGSTASAAPPRRPFHGRSTSAHATTTRRSPARSSPVAEDGAAPPTTARPPLGPTSHSGSGARRSCPRRVGPPASGPARPASEPRRQPRSAARGAICCPRRRARTRTTRRCRGVDRAPRGSKPAAARPPAPQPGREPRTPRGQSARRPNPGPAVDAVPSAPPSQARHRRDFRRRRVREHQCDGTVSGTEGLPVAPPGDCPARPIFPAPGS